MSSVAAVSTPSPGAIVSAPPPPPPSGNNAPPPAPVSAATTTQTQTPNAVTQAKSNVDGTVGPHHKHRHHGISSTLPSAQPATPTTTADQLSASSIDIKA